eukprot:2417975-Rhodomonas_salina.1
MLKTVPFMGPELPFMGGALLPFMVSSVPCMAGLLPFMAAALTEKKRWSRAAFLRQLPAEAPPRLQPRQ